MLRSLRSRLLLSYAAVIGATLVTVALALSVLLIRERIPLQESVRRLTDVATRSTPRLRNAPDINAALDRIAREENVRIIRLRPNAAVAYDSAGELVIGQRMNLQQAQMRQPERGPAKGNFTVQQGFYIDPTTDQPWAFVAISQEGGGRLIFSEPIRRLPIVDAFGDARLLPRLMQAGVIGLLLGAVLAALISRSVAKPLAEAAQAAHAIAEGDYSHRVPPKGPSEVRDLSRSFNHMATEVQHTQQMQRDFLANVSHELRTPLTSVQGFAQAILDEATDDPQRAAQVIYDEAGRMRRLVDDLLELARIESAQVTFRREPVDVAALTEAVVERLAIQANGVRISHQADDVPPVTGDGDRLAQVFTNLIDNAITHTPSGGDVTVYVRSRGGGVEASIHDTGPGIPPDDLARIFERFYQVDKSRKRRAQGGAGLGLTIAQEIVHAHGGTIHAERPADGGTRFRVWLPSSSLLGP